MRFRLPKVVIGLALVGAGPLLVGAGPAPTVVLIPSLTVVSRAASIRSWPVTIIVTSRTPVQVTLDTLTPIPAPGTGASAFAPAGPAPQGWSWAVGQNGPLVAGTYHWSIHASRLPATATYVGVVVTNPPPPGGSVHIAQQAIAVFVVPGPVAARPQAPTMTWSTRWVHGAWQITLSAHNPGPTSYLINGRLDFYDGTAWVGDHPGIVWPLLLPETTATRVVTVPATAFPERVRLQWYWGTAPQPGSAWFTLAAVSNARAGSHPPIAHRSVFTSVGHWLGRHPNAVGAGTVAAVAGVPTGVLVLWDRRRGPNSRSSFWGF